MTPSPTKSLLIGASGQIGNKIRTVLGPARCLVTSRNPASPAELPLDLAKITSREEAEHILAPHPLDAIYCIAGMTNVDGCEDLPDLAHATNCRGPEMLARVATERQIPFVYFSTEYVFDGTAGPYHEDDPVNPLSVYGRSKWDGELAVLAACPNALILRTTVVYGPDDGQKNYLYSLMRSLASGKTMRVPMDQVSTPTYNRDVARATVALVERAATGIFHACGPERMGRLEFATSVAAHLGLNATLLTGLPTSALGQKAPRPLSAGLSIDKLRHLHPDLTMRSLAESLADCSSDIDRFLSAYATLT